MIRPERPECGHLSQSRPRVSSVETITENLLSPGPEEEVMRSLSTRIPGVT